MKIEEMRVGELIPGAEHPEARLKPVGSHYYVSDDGRVFTFWRNYGKWKEQKRRPHTNGYIRATIDGHDAYMHRLVAEAFCENPKNYREVNHKDGDKTNNRAENLEWCTRSGNNRHAFQTGLRDYEELRVMARSEGAQEARRRRRKLTEEQVREIRLSKETDTTLSRIYGLHRGAIYSIRKGLSYKEVV